MTVQRKKKYFIPRFWKITLVVYAVVGIIVYLGATQGIFEKLQKKLENNNSALISSNNHSPKPNNPQIFINELNDLVNKERVYAGLKPLSINQKLVQAAQMRVDVIVEETEWSHQEPKKGITYQVATAKVGYFNNHLGENLAKDYQQDEQIVSNWMLSKEHRENILDPNYQETGLAMKPGFEGNNNNIIVVQLFGGYIPPSYSQADIDSWKSVLQNLQSILPSWEAARGYGEKYENNKTDYERLISIIEQRIEIHETVISEMENHQELGNLPDLDRNLSNEANILTNKLNSK